MDRIRNTGRATLALIVLASAAITLATGSALAQELGGGFQPRVPISAFARPAGWLDPSRLHIGTSVSVGTGWGGKTSGLQVTSFSYQFQRPAWLEVSLGNSFGARNAGRNGMFLESLRFGFRPSANTSFQVQFRDLRSPLRNPYASEPFGAYRW